MYEDPNNVVMGSAALKKPEKLAYQVNMNRLANLKLTMECFRAYTRVPLAPAPVFLNSLKYTNSVFTSVVLHTLHPAELMTAESAVF